MTLISFLENSLVHPDNIWVICTTLLMVLIGKNRYHVTFLTEYHSW